MEEKFRKITVTDENGNIKNIQEYEHNSYGDPTYFKKTVGDKVLTEIFYSYNYEETAYALKKGKILESILMKLFFQIMPL